MRESKEILLNELGVVYNSGDDDKDEILQTNGTVEGGIYMNKAAHFEWLIDVAHSFDLDFNAHLI